MVRLANMHRFINTAVATFISESMKTRQVQSKRLSAQHFIERLLPQVGLIHQQLNTNQRTLCKLLCDTKALCKMLATLSVHTCVVVYLTGMLGGPDVARFLLKVGESCLG